MASSLCASRSRNVGPCTSRNSGRARRAVRCSRLLERLAEAHLEAVEIVAQVLNLRPDSVRGCCSSFPARTCGRPDADLLRRFRNPVARCGLANFAANLCRIGGRARPELSSCCVATSNWSSSARYSATVSSLPAPESAQQKELAIMSPSHQESGENVCAPCRHAPVYAGAP